LRDESGQTVLVVAGVLTGIALTALALFLNLDAGQRILNRLKSGNAGQATAQQAVLAYYFQHMTSGVGVLPCPDTDSAPDGDANDTDIGASHYCDGTSDHPNAGVLPWKTLGLSRDQALDGNGNYLTYVVAPALSAKKICDTVATDFGGGDEVTGALSGSTLTITTSSGASQEIPFAIIGHGSNGLGARTQSNHTTSTPVSDGELANCDPAVAGCSNATVMGVSPPLVAGPFAGSQGDNAFDDQVYYPTNASLAKVCQSLTPGGALNAALTDSFDQVENAAANDVNGDGLDDRKYSADTHDVSVVQDTHSPGNRVAQFSGGGGVAGAALITNISDYDFDPRVTPAYVSTIWFPDVTAQGAGGLSIVTRVTGQDQSTQSDDFAANGKHGITMRFYDAGLASNISAAGTPNYLSIRSDGLCVSTSGTGSCNAPSGGTYNLIWGKSYLVEAFDDGSHVWGRITQTDDAANTATVGPFAVAADLDGSNQIAIVGGKNVQYIDNLTIGYGGLMLDLNGAGYMSTANLAVGTNSNTSPYDGNATFEAWVRPTRKTGAEATIMGSWDVDALSPSSNSFRVYLDADNKLSVDLAGTHTAGSPPVSSPFSETHTFSTLPTGDWTHVAVTYNAVGKSVKLYLNGSLASSDASQLDATHLQDGSGNFLAGASLTTSGFGDYFAGQISDVRVWVGERSAANIYADYQKRLPYTSPVSETTAVNGDDANLLLNWKLDADRFNGIDIDSLTAVSTGTSTHDGVSNVTAGSGTVTVSGNITGGTGGSGGGAAATGTATITSSVIRENDTVGVTLTNAALFSSPRTVSYTITGADVLSGVIATEQTAAASGLASAINQDQVLSALGFSAAASGNVVTVSEKGTVGNSTVIASTVSNAGGGTEVMTASGTFAGTGTGDTVALTFSGGLFSTAHRVSYTITSSDSGLSGQANRRAAVASGLAAAINADTLLLNAKVSASSSGAVLAVSQLGSTAGSTVVANATANYTNAGSTTLTNSVTLSAASGTIGDTRYAAGLAKYFRPFATAFCPAGTIAHTYECDFRNAPQTFNVTFPSNLDGAYVKTWGGGGGGFQATIDGTPYASAGGGGGFSAALIAAIGGATISGASLDVVVGGGGKGSTGSAAYADGTATTGGYGNGAGGGGASGIRLTASTVGLAAGGGGGASFSNSTLLDTGGATDCSVLIDDPGSQCGLGGGGGGAGLTTAQAPDNGAAVCGGRGGDNSPGSDPPDAMLCAVGGGAPSGTGGGGDSTTCGTTPLPSCGGASDLGAGGNGYAASSTAGGVGGGGGGGGVSIGDSSAGGGGAGAYGLLATNTLTVTGAASTGNPVTATFLSPDFTTPYPSVSGSVTAGNSAGTVAASLASAISGLSSTYGITATRSGRVLTIYWQGNDATSSAYMLAAPLVAESLSPSSANCGGNGAFSTVGSGSSAYGECDVTAARPTGLVDGSTAPQTGDTITIAFRNTTNGHAHPSADPVSVSYQVTAADTTMDILAGHLANAIATDADLIAGCPSSSTTFCFENVFATGSTIHIEDHGLKGQNTTFRNAVTYTLPSGETSRVTIGTDNFIAIGKTAPSAGGSVTTSGSSNGYGGGGGSAYKDTTATGVQGQTGLAYAKATVGTVTATHTVAITFTNAQTAAFPSTQSVTVGSTDSSTTVAARLASLINANLAAYGISATSLGADITILQQGWYTQPLGTTTTLTSAGSDAVTFDVSGGYLTSGYPGGYGDYTYAGPGYASMVGSTTINLTPGRAGSSGADGSAGAVQLFW
jgi:hypothetical protein